MFMFQQRERGCAKFSLSTSSCDGKGGGGDGDGNSGYCRGCGCCGDSFFLSIYFKVTFYKIINI